jgi:GDP-D-mannose dehydratase
MVELLHGQDIELIGTYYDPTINIRDISDKAKLVKCDVRYLQPFLRVITTYQPDVIYHLAAQSYPAVSWDQPQATFEINIGGTVNLFEAIKLTRSVNADYDPVVVVACSSAEYGLTLDEIEDPAVKETAVL